jgi:hypothetical protein
MKRYALIPEQLAAVQSPDGDGSMIVPGYDEDYTEDHPLVRAYPYMFREEGTEPKRRGARDSVPIPQVERATQAPGETRPPTVVVPRKAGRPRRNPDGVQPDGWGD